MKPGKLSTLCTLESASWNCFNKNRLFSPVGEEGGEIRRQGKTSDVSLCDLHEPYPVFPVGRVCKITGGRRRGRGVDKREKEF